jgi:hypothetical protein
MELVGSNGLFAGMLPTFHRTGSNAGGGVGYVFGLKKSSSHGLGGGIPGNPPNPGFGLESASCTGIKPCGPA